MLGTLQSITQKASNLAVLPYNHSFFAKDLRHMADLLSFLGLVLGASILLHIAFPNLILPEEKPKKKRVGSTYWGVYDSVVTDEPEEMKTIEVPKAARKERVVAGSSMYAAGRGTSFRR